LPRLGPGVDGLSAGNQSDELRRDDGGEYGGCQMLEAGLKPGRQSVGRQQRDEGDPELQPPPQTIGFGWQFWPGRHT
jgi:hypothetical protein